MLLTLLGWAACRPFDLPSGEESPGLKTMSELAVPAGFKYATTQAVRFRIGAVDNKENPLAHVPFRVLAQTAEGDSTRALLFSGMTDAAGNFEGLQELPLTAQTLVVETDFPGLPAVQLVLDGQTEVDVTLGANNQAKDRAGFSTEMSHTNGGGTAAATDRSGFTYMGTYNSQGVPNYLMAQGDAVGAGILSMLANSLPEGQSVPTVHPAYIANVNEPNTVIKKACDVWVTFVSESTNYRNAVGYYTHPPQSQSDNFDLKVVFPNTSFEGSGGGLHTGDKVFLGHFNPGTKIRWFLMPDGWLPNSQTVTDANHPTRYSDKQYNNFAAAQYRQHTVQLWDDDHDLLLIGMEDRDRPSGDNDFNDAVFYVTASDSDAFDLDKVPQAEHGNDNNGNGGNNGNAPDDDGDGVPNNSDDAPNDPSYAYRVFTPSQNGFSSMAFEDLFPKKGDFDMNDLVVDNHFEERLNAANKITQIIGDFSARAMGGSLRNGFGIELPVAASNVASVTGQIIKDNIITLAANGTEQGNTKAVIFPFDNVYNAMVPFGTTSFANTVKGGTTFNTVTAHVVVTFTTPVSRSELGTAPYNSFIILHRERGKEVHLPGKMPTAKVNPAYFNTADDATNLVTGYTYQTANGLPWAINLPVSFQYPIEGIPVNQAYLKFNNWAESGGHQFSDWYQNQGNGYRSSNKIY